MFSANLVRRINHLSGVEQKKVKGLRATELRSIRDSRLSYFTILAQFSILQVIDRAIPAKDVTIPFVPFMPVFTV